MKKYLGLSFLFLVACSTGSKDVDTGFTVPDAESPSNSGPMTKPIVSETAPGEKAPEPVRRETPSSAYAPLSDAYRSQNDEAISKAAGQILSQNPQDVKALNAMGLYHYRKSHFQAARYFFSRALQVNPNSGELYNNLGLVSVAMNEQHDGIRNFRKALEINSSDGIAAANLGSIYVQEGDYVKASTVLEIAVKKGMRESRTLTNYGIALSAVGKYDSAKLALEDALKQNSSNKEALYALASLLVDRMKQYSDGLDHLNRLRFLGPGPEMRNKMNALENRAKTGIK